MKPKNYYGVGLIVFLFLMGINHFVNIGFSLYQMIIISLVFQALAMLQYIIDKFDI